MRDDGQKSFMRKVGFLQDLRGVTAKEIGKVLGTTSLRLKHLQEGKGAPLSVKEANTLCKFFGVDITYMMEDCADIDDNRLKKNLALKLARAYKDNSKETLRDYELAKEKWELLEKKVLQVFEDEGVKVERFEVGSFIDVEEANKHDQEDREVIASLNLCRDIDFMKLLEADHKKLQEWVKEEKEMKKSGKKREGWIVPDEKATESEWKDMTTFDFVAPDKKDQFNLAGVFRKKFRSDT